MVITNAFGQEDICNVISNLQPNDTDFGYFTIRELKVEKAGSKFDGILFVWIALQIKDVRLKVKDIRRQGMLNGIYEAVSFGDEFIVLSGGFFDDNKKPDGLVVVNRQVISNLEPWDQGGIIYQKGIIIGLTHIKQWTLMPNQVDYALQSKPLVVERGNNGICVNQDIRANRVGIGFNNRNELLICGAFSRNLKAISLYDFGKLMALSVQRGGPGGRNVLGLEGGPGAHIYIPPMGKHFGYGNNNFVANTIHLIPAGS